ncbi:MAG: proline--tRNA ligase [Actinomycetia bacterium]|nr:proline--tRNA ligase [Actinomycetes bacterium]MCP3912815.1 proline--tRNA ligase [Actinomycetes bacterium]MCP4084866.1 proline--tRNA ligase [Actinomycetes bacterium]
MRWSTLFIPTLRDAPGDAEAASHQLLIRGGFIRQLHAGHYTLLPLGFRVRQKVAAIVRDEMDAIGGQEMQMPTMHPATIWQQSERWESMGDVMFRLQDRHGVDTALGVTAEEIFATHATELSSYRQLPQIWYQIHTKFRDEARPKSGLLRVREFAMKDSYSFDVDEDGLDRSFDLHHSAYAAIFERLGLDAVPVEASSGNMGGSDSIEFMVPAAVGEDDVVRCPDCGYAANVEKATSALPAIADPEGIPEPEPFPTPGVRTIAALEEIEGGAPADRQIKTLVFVIDGDLTLALVRGDHQLNEQKLADATGALALRPASADEIHAALGAHPGSLGAVGLSGLRIVADPALRGRRAMTTGANDDDWHLRGVDVDRDIIVDEWVDLRQVEAGEACPNCGAPVEVGPAVEVGHIFKLGRKYAETFGVKVLDKNSETRTVIMGSYGIGIDRGIAIVAETHHDDKGLVWPVSVAPYEVVITVMRLDDDVLEAAEGIYQELRKQGVDVLLDDRDARPGVKFADSELIGVPWRITVGPKGLANGAVELTERAGMETVDVPVGDIVDTVAAKIREAR